MMPSGKARLAGVIGWPVGHSLSPRVHGYWLREHGIDGAYVALAVSPGEVAAALAGLRVLGFAGANVTVPHKEAAMEAVDSCDDTARRIGAVNTLIVKPDGSITGTSTDGFGFCENLVGAIPNWAPTGPAVVLGAGGAARAIAFALTDAGVPEIRIVNRTHWRGEELASAVGKDASFVAWDSRSGALDGAKLLVNATSLGMNSVPPLSLSLDVLPTDAVVADVVYAPLETPLLGEARARGNSCVDGLGMLLHQARPGFAAWFGLEPKVTPELRAFVLGRGEE